jgi:hypothetical protein
MYLPYNLFLANLSPCSDTFFAKESVFSAKGLKALHLVKVDLILSC